MPKPPGGYYSFQNLYHLKMKKAREGPVDLLKKLAQIAEIKKTLQPEQPKKGRGRGGRGGRVQISHTPTAPVRSRQMYGAPAPGTRVNGVTHVGQNKDYQLTVKLLSVIKHQQRQLETAMQRLQQVEKKAEEVKSQ
jgi:hypothetical protein